VKFKGKFAARNNLFLNCSRVSCLPCCLTKDFPLNSFIANRLISRVAISLAAIFMLSACDKTPEIKTQFSPQEHNAMIGQKLMLDMRFFCDDGTPGELCKTPVTELTPELTDIIVSANIGGIIFFAENLTSIDQIIKLNHDIQLLADKSDMPALFIAVDQEGGRVARFDDAIVTRFVGNMAIGATYNNHGTRYAYKVNAGIANAISLLGFNLNFAPTVDVNVNPDNPVINVRSYGENANQVAALGEAAVRAMQLNGVASAMKHFPGHGDTRVDSHTGLPRVDHSPEDITNIDLLPFAQAIASDEPPAMIMTAHIQYPQLDSTAFTAKDGSTTIVPATLSRKILTDLLRNKMQYQGVIVTDALDMAGISHYLDESEAVIKTFQAGADIALMPYRIRTPEDIEGFWKMHKKVLNAVANGTLSEQEISDSANRISALKKQFSVGKFARKSMVERQEIAHASLPLHSNQVLEADLATASLTLLYDKHKTLPLAMDGHWLLVMPDTARCAAMATAITKLKAEIVYDCLSLASIPQGAEYAPMTQYDAVILGDISPQHSLAEMGGMDDLSNLKPRANKEDEYAFFHRLLQQAKDAQVPRVFVALRAPYVVSDFVSESEVAIATFGYNVTTTEDQQATATGATFDALAQVLVGNEFPQGSLPVTVSDLPKGEASVVVSD
jgi:beta-N-acetylhexosaminidase